MPNVQALYAQIGFLFETDDGSLPEVRLTGLTASQTPLVYSRLRGLSSGINQGAYFWDRRAGREAPVDSVPNAAALVASGAVEAFHFVLREPRLGAVGLPELGVFVAPDEIALDYRMGPAWGPPAVAALLELCELLRLAPGSTASLEDHVLDEVRDRFARAVAQYCDHGCAV